MAATIDKDGYYLDGRFAGKHVSVVAQYAESLEDAATGKGKAPTKLEEKKTPEGELERHAVGRVDAATAAAVQRMLGDDEADFRAKVGEERWGKVKTDIQNILKTMPPQTLMTKGIHWTIYLQLVARDPEVEARILGKAEKKETPPTETPEQKEAREAAEAEAAEKQKADEIAAAEAKLAALRGQAPPVPGGPKAAPPTVPPTGGRSSGGAKERKPKLVPNDKIRRSAREWGVPVEKMLLDMEDRGVTQDQIDTMSVPKEETRRKTVFDRATAR